MNLNFAEFQIKYNQKHLDNAVLHTSGKMKHGGITLIDASLDANKYRGFTQN